MSLVNAIRRNDMSAMDMLAADKGKNQKETVKQMFSQLVQDKQAEYFTRIQNGTSEQSFQIGAGSYTQTEWQKLLKGFDVAEAKLHGAAGKTAEVQKTSQTPHSKLTGYLAKNHNEIGTSDEDSEIKEKSVEMLLAEFTTATYPSSDKDIPDDVYYTFYTPDGIYCRKQGQSEFEWQFPLEDYSQYEKVMSYLQSFDSQDNLRFACHENFWQDFLTGQVDMDKFDDFWETRVIDGVPNYLNVYENGVNINKEAAQYSKYMNLPDFVTNMCYTSEEAFRTFFNHRKVAENAQPDHEVIDMKHLDQYYAKHPNEIGGKNHYYNGRWYSMIELAAIWNMEFAELFRDSQEK